MYKVIHVVDKKETAIDRLAQGIKPYLKNYDYTVVDFHPKRPDTRQIEQFEKEAKDAQIIDFGYWKTALVLLERYPWLKDKKKILTHYNPYSITESDWKQFDVVVACNKEIHQKLEGSVHIPLTIDTDFWTYNDEWEKDKSVIMVANRIESKKGIKEVAQACHELGLEFHLVGQVSDGEYFMELAKYNIKFHENISDEQLKKLYYKSTIHICNSVDNFESGTLPILEAMLCGTPVLTRKIGHVPELYDGENMIIQDSRPDDVEAIKAKLRMMLEETDLNELREKAWKTAYTRSNVRRAYEYAKIYHKLMGNEIPVSVIVPIYAGDQQIEQCLRAIEDQTYENIEIIVSNDNPNVDYELLKLKRPLKYINTSRPEDDYGLARARNIGAIEATGEILVFIDQRQIPEPDAVRNLVQALISKTWVYGNKGARKEFVENASAIYRKEFIEAGMFNERCTQYGCLSQETRSRFRAQGFKFEFIENAKFTPIGKSSNRWRKRAEIIKSKDTLYKMGL